MITFEEAKELKHREVLIDSRDNRRWYVNGKVRTWVRMPTRIRIPVKHGLYVYGAIRENDLQYFTKERD